MGGARAGRGPLLLAAAVVVLATLLASAVPAAIRGTADDAVADAVTRAGTDAALVVDAPFEREDPTERIRRSRSAAILEQSAGVAQFRLSPALDAVLRPPVAAVTSTPLQVTGGGPGRTIRLSYVTVGAGARLVWTAGGTPQASVPAADADTAVRGAGPWPVQVGLTQETATALRVAPGDRVSARDPRGRDLDVRVSGIFRALDADDPSWQDAQLLRPVVAGNGPDTSTAMAGLLSADSLPDGRLALDEGDVRSTIVFTPEPTRLHWRDAEAVAAAVVALKATSGPPGEALRWDSRLDTVLRDARAEVTAAAAQASVLLVGLVTTAALVLLLAADLLVRRRAAVLAGARMRGASLPGIGAELAVESGVVALAAGALGLLLGRVFAAGPSWRWPVPVVVVAVLAGPLLGMRVAARAGRARQRPANRSARRSARHTRQLRRVALETAVVLAAAGAVIALRERGVVSASGGVGLPALAPTLLAVTGALLLLRLLPPTAGLALALAARSRRSLPLLSAARAAETAARPLPFLVLVVSSTLLTYALSLSATESAGLAATAWQTVGADARLVVGPSESVPAITQRLAASTGVRQTVAAAVVDDVPAVSAGTTASVRFVVVDAVAFRQLLASTPLPDAPQLDRLHPTGGRVPALLRTSDVALRSAHGTAVRWHDTTVGLNVVGTAPAVGTGEGDVLVVDAAAFAGAGAAFVPNTVWVVGPRAAAAAAGVAGPDDVVTLRSDVVAARRSAPLAAGLLHLAATSAVVLSLLGLLGVVLGAAASAPARRETLARLRTLGLRSREARQVAVGELLPPVVLGGVGGAAFGVLLAYASLSLLDLRLLTGQATAPAVVVPPVTVVPVALLVAAVFLMIEVESSRRERLRLDLALRAGTE